MADTIKIIDPYDSYTPYTQEDAEGVYGNDFLNAVKSLQVGFGSQVLRIDRQGLWLGSEDFATAPFSVDMDGNIVADTIDLSGFLEIGEALGDIGAGNITGTYIASGTITTAKLEATAIDGMTITGALIRTSATGARVQILASTNTLQILDANGKVRAESYSNGWQFNNSVGASAGRIFIDSTSHRLDIQASESDLFLSSISDIAFAPSYGAIKGYFSSSGFTLNDDLQMNGNDINGCGDITMDGDANDLTNVDRVEGLAGYIDLGYSSYFTVENDWVPQSDNTYDLGLSSTEWQDAYINEVHYGTLTATSDKRLKENISDIAAGLAAIVSLKPVNFNYKEKKTELQPDRKRVKNKDKNMKDFAKRSKEFLVKRKARADKQHYGFIAQDVQKVLPELVGVGKEDKMLNLNQTELIPFLVKAIQELKAEIDSLKTNK